MEQKTVAEWRKLLVLSYGCSGITIKGIKGEVTELEIPEVIGKQQVVGIDVLAFYNCSSLTKITIPHTVKRIESGAFNCCTNLASVDIRNEEAFIEDSVCR